MTREEFAERVTDGEQLVILDDMVLDVSKFKPNHPGGKFVLEFNVGRDVSKFFYGGYTLENSLGMAPHTHSNIARRIVNTLAIARLEDSAAVFNVKIDEKIPINSTCSTFVMKI
jgi:cytochrome b involved in lipid metabolism